MSNNRAKMSEELKKVYIDALKYKRFYSVIPSPNSYGIYLARAEETTWGLDNIIVRRLKGIRR